MVANSGRPLVAIGKHLCGAATGELLDLVYLSLNEGSPFLTLYTIQLVSSIQLLFVVCNGHLVSCLTHVE